MSERVASAVAPAWAAPPVLRSAQTGPDRPESLLPLIDALAAVAAAGSVDAVCAAAVAGAVALTGARGAALGSRQGDQVRLLASWGYDCDSMAAGAMLPLTAGLPVTESVRTGTTVVRGASGSPTWIAVPVVNAELQAALLVSLPPQASADVGALQTLGRVAADALARCPQGRREAARLLSRDTPPWLRVATLDAPYDGQASGDVVVVGAGTTEDLAWLAVADVCGSGPTATPTASVFRQSLGALIGTSLGPVEVLEAVDRALRREPSADRFVTALIVQLHRLDNGVAALRVVDAGHPSALLWRDGVVSSLGGPTPPLNLLPEELQPAVGAPAEALLRPGDLLFAFTDGLVEHDSGDHTELLVELFQRAGALGDPAVVLDVVTEAMRDVAGPARDDVAAVVVALA
ncbi:MAG TPA: PP2C family protein-serine/threonine phosphatase [Mycobacteriales bacterium]|nr:PP2C family protein-serine/threonine phosphatase [Mycobacteriales bacterium]